MRSHRVLLFVLALLPFYSFAVTINGEIIDLHTTAPVANVHIVNIHSSLSTESDDRGKFSIVVERGQLLEFRKVGYKIVRIRIPEGNIPPYFRVMMQEGPIELPEFNVNTKANDWVTDSTRYYQLYKNALEFPKLEGIDAIQHPFSALSKRNRQIWAFQKEYSYWQQQKYVDYKFNERTIGTLTGLQGDSLQNYMRRYRPPYDQVRAMSDYEFYLYIKQAADLYRRKYVPSIRRSPN
jgi:hypothetical protein